MKLAEALSVRADLQSRIDQLKSRLKYSAKVQAQAWRVVGEWLARATS